MQQETGELKESEDGNVEFGTPTDDEEVTIPSQDRNREVPDLPDSDIRDEQTLSNTQREDWPIMVLRVDWHTTGDSLKEPPEQSGKTRPSLQQL